ncbi:carbohydrate kinase [Lacinutrix sp. C3R15]|uniref:carbohydrate kinase family protein n=1 Tax=Flavobacteriaceae TaxID=49546 RepID=UPI001C0A17D7|nr:MULTISPECIES: carbohydrate kinase [Flavobacteriaceae]MBU2938548.1 carbohydrate kinase [Lacinutrix sp. C3R15]MDO6621862.1 carbohydrate kinase [Oceanihabitans sp. 1_MG-2023]
MKNIVCFGEVLWDVFPSHKKIGGAPLNVALRLQLLNNNVSIISSIGDDEDGEKIKDYIVEQGIHVENLQVDKKLKTGIVQVILNQKGSASYNIKLPRAWDNIKLSESNKKVTENADAFIYGSLAARNSITRNTLYTLLKIAKYKIFDVNLREPYYTIDVLNSLMQEADFIKFNDDEIFEICQSLNFHSKVIEENISYIAEQTNTKSICVTKGSKGAVLYYNGTFYSNTGYTIKVIDTVGAGDSFLATLISKLLNKDNPQEAIDYACAVGALVAGSEGANPIIKEEDINHFIS